MSAYEEKAPIRETVEFNLISPIEASVVAKKADADTLEHKSFTFPSIVGVQIVGTSLRRYRGCCEMVRFSAARPENSLTDGGQHDRSGPPGEASRPSVDH